MLTHEEYGENLSSDGEGNEWEEDYGKLSRELSMEDEESEDRLDSHASAEEGDDEGKTFLYPGVDQRLQSFSCWSQNGVWQRKLLL